MSSNRKTIESIQDFVMEVTGSMINKGIPGVPKYSPDAYKLVKSKVAISLPRNIRDIKVIKKVDS